MQPLHITPQDRISLTNAIFLEFLDERFATAKSGIHFTLHFLEMLHYLARFKRDSYWTFQRPVFDPAFLQVLRCWLTWECNIRDSFSVQGCASFWAHLHLVPIRHLRLRFPEKIPSVLKGKFSSNTSYQKANRWVSDRESYTE